MGQNNDESDMGVCDRALEANGEVYCAADLLLECQVMCSGGMMASCWGNERRHAGHPIRVGPPLRRVKVLMFLLPFSHFNCQRRIEPSRLDTITRAKKKTLRCMVMPISALSTPGQPTLASEL